MATARAVANFFIKKASDEGLELDQLKLQKLVYYAYAWNAAHDKDPLFEEDVIAWPHGPVVRELWEEFKSFGREPIDRFALETDWMQEPPTTSTPIAGDSEFERRLLSAVWDRYKKFSGVSLSNMTHGPDEPWSIVKKQMPNVERPRIPHDLIKKQFEPRLVRKQPAG